jgi:hypothetical protein
MLRLLMLPLLVGLASSPANAIAGCPFCSGDTKSRLTLRMQYAQAKVVVQGKLKNPRFDPKTDAGFTDLQIDAILKEDPACKVQGVVTLRSYIPVVGNTPPDFLFFCGIADGKLDPTSGIPCTPAIIEYLKSAAKLNDIDPVAKLGFYFKHLDSSDATIAADAFFEFARASDGEIAKAAKQFDAAKIRKLIASPTTPVERLGVLAFLLGISGGPLDTPFLAGMLSEKPLSDRSASAFGGLLAGYILLNPKDGWQFAANTLGDAKQSFAVRLSAIGTVRFLQATRGNDCKTDVLRCCSALLSEGDLADQAIEDLRRWGYWDLTADVLAQFPKPTHAAPIVQRCIVRYALCCPDEQAKRFVSALRRTDPKLVEKVEEVLDLYAPVPTAPKKNP